MLKKQNKTMRDRYFWIAAAPLYTQSVAQQKKKQQQQEARARVSLSLPRKH